MSLQKRYPDYAILQLALRGRGAFAVFEDLAEDLSFRGRIVFCLTEPDLSLGAAEEQREAVLRAEEAGPDAIWNAFIRARVASHLVTRLASMLMALNKSNLATLELYNAIISTIGASCCSTPFSSPSVF